MVARKESAVVMYAQKYLILPHPDVDFYADPSKADVIDPFVEHSAAKFPLGTELRYGNKWYRYALNGAVALLVGKLIQSPVIEANGDHTDMAVDAVVKDTVNWAGVTNGSNTAITKDEFAQGELHVNDDTGEGYAYTVKKHAAIATSASGTITTYEKNRLLLGAGATVSLTHSPFYKAIVHPSPPTARLIGVPNIPVTIAYYFWAQYRGPCAVLTDGTTTNISQGQPVRPSEDDDGAVAIRDLSEAGRDEVEVGIAMHVNADGEYSLVYLTLD